MIGSFDEEAYQGIAHVLISPQNMPRMLEPQQEMLIDTRETAYVVSTWPFDLLKERKAVIASFSASPNANCIEELSRNTAR